MPGNRTLDPLPLLHATGSAAGRGPGQAGRPTRRQFTGWSAAAAAAVAAPGVWAQARPAAGRKLVIGQSAALTGPAAEIALAYFAGAKLYFDAWNEKSANTTKIEFRSVDDAYDPARAAANARKLLGEGAEALFGFVGTASGDAAAAVAKDAGVVFFAPFAGSDALRDAGNAHVFHVRPSMNDEAVKIVRHTATLNQTRIAFLAEDDAMGRAALESVNQALKDNNRPPLVASAFVPVNSDRVDAGVAAIIKAQPQAVIQAALFNSSAAFIRKMRKAGFGGTFMSFSVVGIDPLFSALGKEISGVVISQVVPSPRSGGTPIVKEYLDVLNNTDQTPSYESLEGFIAAKVFAEGVKRAGGKASGLSQAFAGMSNHDVGGFRVNLRAARNEGVRAVDLVTITGDGRVVR